MVESAGIRTGADAYAGCRCRLPVPGFSIYSTGGAFCSIFNYLDSLFTP